MSFDFLELGSLEVLKLERALEPPGKLVKTEIAGPHPQDFEFTRNLHF